MLVCASSRSDHRCLKRCPLHLRASLQLTDKEAQDKILTLDSGRVDVGVLGGGVVAPDDGAGHVLDIAAGLDGELANRAVVIEAGEGGEVLCNNQTVAGEGAWERV